MIEPVQRLLPEALELPAAMTRQAAVYPAVITFVSDAALFLGDRSAIQRMMPHVEQFDGYNLVVGQSVAVLGSANTVLARMHLALGHMAESETHFRRALEMDIAVESLVHQSMTLARFAELADAVGDTDRARDYRERARALAEPIGQKRVLALVDGAGQAHPDGLTSREVDVLRLLAEGASNREIGDRLYISQNTVANHVRSILAKTATPNRTAAATYAIERRLV